MSQTSTPVLALLGPVIGKVSATSAVVMLEVATRGLVRCVLTDSLTLEQHAVVRVMPARRPATFVFTTLLPGRRYEVSVGVRV